MSAPDRRRTDWPAYLLDRAAMPPPEDCAVVRGSTPVVSFGDPLRATVATLGINPSSGEFIAGGRLLSGTDRRLATLASLGISDYGEIDDAIASEIIDDCATYFDRKPYRWFNPLDRILQAALGVSYYDGTACHLDLVQWATDPIWKELPDDQRRRLIDEGLPFLKQQLQRENYRVVVVAGRTALEGAERSGLLRWQHVARLPAPPAADVYVADVGNARFIGWSSNLQSQPGALKHADALIGILREHGRHAVPVPMNERIERGARFATTREMVGRLREWLAGCDDETLGDVSSFAGTPWARFETPLGDAAINADTTRQAIERMVAAGGAKRWRVIENSRGRVNKVVFDADDSHEGWYAYLRKPLSAPEEFDV